MNLAVYRNKNKLSQAEVAKVLGVSKSSYGHYETGRNLIPLDKLIKLSNFYDVPVQALIGDMETDRDYSLKLLALAYGLKKKEMVPVREILELEPHKREKLLKSFGELVECMKHKEME